MKNKAIFLDRDGTINHDPGYVHKIEDFMLYNGVVEGLKMLKDFKLFIITNQSGIGRGYYKEEDMHKFNKHLLDELNKKGITIEKVYYCPHAPEQSCDCRKPSPKFIKEAEKEFNLDLKNSFVIGDHGSDIKLAKNSGCGSVYLLTGHGKKHFEEAKKLSPDFIAENFIKAAGWISENAH
jgi:D-glycero-D-manno-heptose 1,7-bisphosphate phosphatase